MEKSTSKELSLGIERHIDDLGRIVIPKEMRNEVVSIKLFDDHIEIAKSKSKCLFCSTQDNIKYYNNYSICQSCLDDIIKKFSE